ncbi:MAG: BatA domain-containing protein [Planctomycetota bacterium]
MTFLNTTLLLGLAAAAIPLVMHLIARREPRQIRFPSVRLLTQRVETNRSRMKVRRWWLLALRVAAFAVVAFALARPAISSSLSLTWTTIGILATVAIAFLALASVAAASASQRRGLVWSLLSAGLVAMLAAVGWGGYTLASGQKPAIDEQTPIALAIVIDNAPLSGWTDGESDQLAELSTAALQLIESAGPQSRLAILDRSSTPASFALDNAGAVSKAKQVSALELTQPLPSRIEAAVRLLETSEIESRHLVVVSGLPESSFNSDAPESLEGLIDRSGVRLTFWRVGQFDGVNRSLSEPTLSDQSPGPERPVQVSTTLSFGGQLPEGQSKLDVTAECVLFPSNPSLPVVRDGEIVRPEAKPVDRMSVELEPGRELELSMTLPPMAAGLHHGAIRLIGADALAVDDAAYFTVSVLPPSQLLIVGDQVDEAAEIAWTITAPDPIDDPGAQYAISRIAYDKLAVTRLSDFDGVVLLDPSRGVFEEPEINRFLAGSGGLLVAAGGQFDRGDSAVELLPGLVRPWRVPDPGSFFEITSTSHPALAGLAAIEGGVPFPDFRVWQYWQLQPRDGDQVLMRFAGTEHPALIESVAPDNGEARILVLATPVPELARPAKAWNALFSADEPWPAFLLVRDLVRYLTGRNAENYTSSVGSPITLTLDSAKAGSRLQWFPSQGQTPIPVDVPKADLDDESESVPRRVVLGQAKDSGVHWVRGDRKGLGFTVNLPRSGLVATAVDAQRLDEVFGAEKYQQIDGLEEIDWNAGEQQASVSLWSPTMLVALFVFMLEQVLGNRFYSSRSAAKKPLPSRRAA